MAARDKIYEPVLKALDNDQWTITDDPLILGYEEIRGLRVSPRIAGCFGCS